MNGKYTVTITKHKFLGCGHMFSLFIYVGDERSQDVQNAK